MPTQEEFDVMKEQMEVAIDRAQSWKNLAEKYQELAEARMDALNIRDTKPPFAGVKWWMEVAEAKQEERDAALKRLQTAHQRIDIMTARIEQLEKALRYAADCSTLEMVRDAARGMGVIE